MISHGADLDPTVITGGIINAWGTNARIGKGEWMVVEADESDGTFLKLPTQIGVVTNIDPEHMDFWESEDDAASGLPAVHRRHPFYGVAVGCIDHPVVRELLAKLGGAANGWRTLTYGVARTPTSSSPMSAPSTPGSHSTSRSVLPSQVARANSRI